MRKLDIYLRNKRIDYKKLLDVKNCDTQIYEKNICDDEFKVIVEISKENFSKVIDLSSNLEYELVDIKMGVGPFINKIKEEYENILNDIIKNITINDSYKNKQTKELIKYVNKKYGDNLEFLWDNFPTDAIWRNKENNKWYGLLLVINLNKLGLNVNKEEEIIVLRYNKDKIKTIIDNKKIFKGYHMNKSNWITIILNESINIKDIYKFLDNSYLISLKKQF